MAVSYTTTELLNAIRRRGSIPNSQELFSPSDLIDLATDEMETLIVPQIMSVREEYFVTYKDVAVANSSEPVYIPIPFDAIGQKLRDVVWVNNNQTLTSIPRYELEQASGTVYIDTNNRTNGFMVQGNDIVLFPSTSGSGTIRLYYFKRPLVLTATTNCGQITAIDTDTNEVTLSFLPSQWTTGNDLNVINQYQPFETKVTSVAITGISFSTVTVASTDDMSVGDWVALEGYSPIPQLPVEAHKVLAQATVVKCMEAMGDNDGMKASSQKLMQDMENMFKLIAPRVDGAPTKITNAGNGIFDRNQQSGYGYY